jgi:phage minor structural protein
MLQLYTDEQERVGLLVGCKGLHIKRLLDCDQKTLQFSYPRAGKFAAQLKEEAYIRTKTDEFVIKETDRETDDEWIAVTATMNVEGIENCMFAGGFEAVEKTAPQVLAQALQGSGWAVGVCAIKKRRTVRKEDDCNGWDILKQVTKTFRCEVRLDTLAHVIDIYETRGQDRGTFFMEGINLKKLERSSDTYDFFTELIPIGKNGLTLLDDTRDPRLVLSNYSYSRKRVVRIWRDERYTVVENLREDAEAKLAEACVPKVSYRAAVKDLAPGSTEHPDFFEYDLGDVITLISKKTKVRERQRVVSIDEYEHAEDNVLEITTAAKTFAEMQQDDRDSAAETATNLANAYTDASLEGYTTAEEAAEIAQQQSQQDLSDYVKKTDLGNYATKDDLVNATAGVESAKDQATAAAAAANQAAANASAAASAAAGAALANYYTKTETGNAITAAIEAHETAAAETYVKKTELETAAQTAAETATETALQEYEATLEDTYAKKSDVRNLESSAQDAADAAAASAQAAQAAAAAASDKVTGMSTIGAAGTVTVNLPADFTTAAAAAGGFLVFLQAYGAGAVYVSDSDTQTFEATGPEGLDFAWLAVIVPAAEEEPEEEPVEPAEQETEE